MFFVKISILSNKFTKNKHEKKTQLSLKIVTRSYWFSKKKTLKYFKEI